MDYLSIYVDTILSKVEADYDISFSGALLTDADFLEMRIACVQSNLKRNNGSVDIYVDDLIIHDSLSVWDMLKNVMQLTCAVFKISGTDMELQKFDDLDITTPTDWTGKLVSKFKKFSIPNTAQQNFIKYSVVKDVDPFYLSALIECNNLNIDFTKDIVTMKAKLFPYMDINASFTNASANPLLVFGMPDTGTSFPNLPGDPTPERIKGLKDLKIYVVSALLIKPTANTGYVHVPGADSK